MTDNSMEKTSIFRTDGRATSVKKRMRKTREKQAKEFFDLDVMLEKITDVAARGYGSYTWAQPCAVDYSNTEHCSNITSSLEEEGFVVRWEETSVLPPSLQAQNPIENIVNSKIKIRQLQVKWA